MAQRLMASPFHCRMPTSLPSAACSTSTSSFSPALPQIGYVRARGLEMAVLRSEIGSGWNGSTLIGGFCLTLSRKLRGQKYATSARLLPVDFTTEEGKPVDGAREVAEGGQVEKGMRQLAGSNIVMHVNAGKHHLVKAAEFVKSSPREADCPKDGLPEFALVGRSNVGKSSLINSLVNRKELAQTSKTPGKTQLINHYRINNNWYLVDLPGYGYAKAPTAVRTEWSQFTKDYFVKRQSLVSVLLLVDGSIPPLKIDLECANWLGRNKIPVTIVFTKCDRRKKKKNGGKRPEENVKDFEKEMEESFDQIPPWIMTSSVTGQGKDELLQHIARLRDFWNS